jgi:hypothetical protein
VRARGGRVPAVLAATVVGLVALTALVVAEQQAASPSHGEACPGQPRQTQPVAFHFVPGLVQHRSWIEFAIPEPDATSFTLCLDGNLWERGIGETPQGGFVRVSVNTKFVDVEWLLGRLDDFQHPGRWQLGYTTYTIENG